MNEDQKESIKKLEEIIIYFKRQAINNSRFIPEYDIISRIVNYLKSRTELFDLDFQKIMNIHNEIIDHEHYNGSGWHDFQIRLTRFFREFGYETIWDTETDGIMIKTLPNTT